MFLIAGCAGCGTPGARTAPDTALMQDTPGVPQFRDVAAERGVRFSQGVEGKRPLTILEATGSGGAFGDFDNDGWLDLFLVGQPRCAFYRNNRDGTFSEKTQEAGLGATGFRIGCATGDYDNDGDTDLFVTGYETCTLYRNTGDGRFTDATAGAGIRSGGFQTSAVFVDLDRDGFLDLYVCRYVHFNASEPQYCRSPDGSVLRTCGPDVYQAEKGVFYHNQRNGAFTDATARFGLDQAHGKAWGAAAADYDGDGWPDLYVANDEMPCDLFRNTRRGRMENAGFTSGTAYNRDGAVQGGMGADFGDFDNDGRLDLVVTNFWMEPNSLYRNQGAGLFTEVSQAAGISAPTARRVGFGTRFFDADNDGRLDLFFLNGHVQDIHQVDPEQGMPQRMQLFLNRGNGRFTDVSDMVGEVFRRPVVGRGAAFGDFDNDGDVDIAALDMEGPAMLLLNEGSHNRVPHTHWLLVRAVAGTPPRDAIGARVTVETTAGSQVQEIRTGGGVLSAHDPRAHFGLGAARRCDRVTVRWPDGSETTRRDVPADRILTIHRDSPR